MIIYIAGIFQSLQRGYDIASNDIEFATEICMEAGLFEVELTDFLSHVCSHMTSGSADNPLTDQVFSEATSTTPKSVKFEIPGLEKPTTEENSSIELSKPQLRTR